MEPYEEAAGRLATDSNIDGPPFSNKMRNASANDLSADMTDRRRTVFGLPVRVVSNTGKIVYSKISAEFLLHNDSIKSVSASVVSDAPTDH
jgi:hypothetical protein